MSNWKLSLAANAVRNGEVIAYPTEAVYGLGCDPWNESAVFSLLSLKKRSVNKGLILIASNLQQLAPFVGDLDPSIKRRVLPTWPGPVTWLIPPVSCCPSFLYGQHNTIAVRVTNHPLVVALCNELDSALVSTSANIQGRDAARTSLRVRQIFGNQLGYILSGETDRALSPSKICHAQTGLVIRPAI
ncbi:MAG TPA: tRNA threonylcarbamoyladenosine biosynthesis protein RimN [Gammaproteobacteria bacterium]|nr:tRNA threonylcarbamoyladenosine biosynthesis protein RimN [Gammaproteobacteria bacterium]